MNNYDISQEDVTSNGRFNLRLLKQKVIDYTNVGDRIYPKSLTRLAKNLGAVGSNETITKNIMAAFNSSDKRLKRRVEKGIGFVYEKVAD